MIIFLLHRIIDFIHFIQWFKKLFNKIDNKIKDELFLEGIKYLVNSDANKILGGLLIVESIFYTTYNVSPFEKILT